jgi:hypothetical protein
MQNFYWPLASKAKFRIIKLNVYYSKKYRPEVYKYFKWVPFKVEDDSILSEHYIKYTNRYVCTLLEAEESIEKYKSIRKKLKEKIEIVYISYYPNKKSK